MDIISFNEAATANGRIEKFIKDPDSDSGIVTVPKVIGAGENVTIPAGRVAVLPNVQVDGTLNVEGEVFIPTGATFSKVVETEGNQTIDGIKTFISSPIVPTPTTGTQAVNKDYVDTKQSKHEISYNGNSSSFITNTLVSGAIIEIGSNTNGNYIKYADGTLVCYMIDARGAQSSQLLAGGIYYADYNFYTFSHSFNEIPTVICTVTTSSGRCWVSGYSNPSKTQYGYTILGLSNLFDIMNISVIAIGKWK